MYKCIVQFLSAAPVATFGWASPNSGRCPPAHEALYKLTMMALVVVSAASSNQHFFSSRRFLPWQFKSRPKKCYLFLQKIPLFMLKKFLVVILSFVIFVPNKVVNDEARRLLCFIRVQIDDLWKISYNPKSSSGSVFFMTWTSLYIQKCQQ